jgi:hypothetical protein
VPLKHKIDPIEADVKNITASRDALSNFIAKVRSDKTEWGKYGQELSKAYKLNFQISQLSRTTADRMDSVAGKTERMGGVLRGVTNAFGTLANHTKSIAEHLGRISVSLLSFATLAGFVGGLVGGGSMFGLTEASQAIAVRRRMLLGVGGSYGAYSSFGLNMGRFVDTQALLGGVFAGTYDVTSPAYRGLMVAGAAPGRTDSPTDTAVDVLRRLPQIFDGTPKELVGPRAQSLGLTDLLSLQDIRRYLEASPEEREKQISQYGADRNSLDLSPAVLEKWQNFTNAVDRAGLRIEAVLGNRLASLSPPLQKLSEQATRFVSALIGSKTFSDAIQKVTEGVNWLAGQFSNAQFKRDMADFLQGMGQLLPLLQNAVSVASGIIRGGWYVGRLFLDPKYNPPSFGSFLNDVLPPVDPEGGVSRTKGPPTTFDRNSIRYGHHRRVRSEQPGYTGTGTHDPSLTPDPYSHFTPPAAWSHAPIPVRPAPHLPPADPHSIRYGHHPRDAYQGLRILPGHGATAGGPVQPGLLDVARELQSSDPSVGFTALNDRYHVLGGGSGPYGAHGQGLAFDATMENIEADKQILRQRMEREGFVEGAWGSGQGDFSIEPGAGGGTGPHLHFQWNSAEAAQRYHAYVEQHKKHNAPRSVARPPQQQTSMLDNLHHAARQPKVVVVENNSNTMAHVSTDRMAWA